jgi:hypothetical protein
MARTQITRGFLIVAVCSFLAVQSLWAGQTAIQELKIEVIQGNGARNVAGRRPPAPLAVRVVDQDNSPSAGVSVVFSAPDSGPGGVFSNGTNVLMTMTDQNGRAEARYEPNSIEGTYSVRVLAREVLVTAIAEIRQNNIAATAPGGKHSTMIKVLAIAGAAAGAGIVLGTRGGGEGSGPGPAPLPSIVFGDSSISPPR